MPNDKKLLAKGYVEKIKEEDGVLDAAVASTAIIDRHGEIIDQSGWDLKFFKKNPIILWSHNSGLGESRPPIGKAIKIWTEGEGRKAKLMFRAQFDMQDSFAALIARKLKDGFLNAFSVGLRVMEMEENVIKNAELLEISVVPVPANPEALSKMKTFKAGDQDIALVDWDGYMGKDDNKGVVPFSSTDITEDGADWDASGAKKRLWEWAGGDFEKYKKGFAWFDESAPEKKSSYKLPHHDIVMGKLTVIWRGTAAAMGALLGARGGVDLSEEDKKAVYTHLRKHYEQYSKDAPDFKFVEAQILKGLDQELTYVYEQKEITQLKAIKKEVKKVKQAVDKKEKQGSPITTNMTNEKLIEALKLVNQATNFALRSIKSNKGKGGE